MTETQPAQHSRARLVWELSIVLALSLGQSALYSVLSFVRALTREAALSEQSTALNSAFSADVGWDILYRVLDVFFDLCLVALVIYLLWEPGRNVLRRMGLDFSRFGSDSARAAVLLAVIGIPGIGLYVVGRLAGVTLEVQAAPLDSAPWVIPLLVLSAVRAGLIEEVIMYGYVWRRLEQLAFSPWMIIMSLALFRGLYHSYQGIGPLIGNVVMGVVFGWCYRRWGRVMPLVIAHTMLDVFAFVGYPLVAPLLP